MPRKECANPFEKKWGHANKSAKTIITEEFAKQWNAKFSNAKIKSADFLCGLCRLEFSKQTRDSVLDLPGNAGTTRLQWHLLPNLHFQCPND